jgi:hypothetical protein
MGDAVPAQTSHRRKRVIRLYTFRLGILVSLALAAAANGGWKWTGIH